MSSIVVRNAEVDGNLTDVRITGRRIEAVGPGLVADDADDVIDADGGALIPGLHDHHVHLLATAAADGSITVGPPRVTNAEQLAVMLRAAGETAPPGSWFARLATTKRSRASLIALRSTRSFRITVCASNTDRVRSGC